MKKNLTLRSFYFLLLFVYSSCCHHEEKGNLEDGSLFGRIMKSDANFFRGIDMRDSLKQVISYHTEMPRQQDSDYLYYRQYLNTKEQINITYNFKENQLYELRLEMKLVSKNRLVELQKQFNDYFDKKYGKSELDSDGFLIWKTQTTKSKDIEISLKDESTEKYAALRVSFYDYEL